MLLKDTFLNTYDLLLQSSIKVLKKPFGLRWTFDWFYMRKVPLSSVLEACFTFADQSMFIIITKQSEVIA